MTAGVAMAAGVAMTAGVGVGRWAGYDLGDAAASAAAIGALLWSARSGTLAEGSASGPTATQGPSTTPFATPTR